MVRITNVFQFLVLILISLSSCAIVTVNVYFPAEEVRSAYEQLYEEYVEPKKGETLEPGKTPEKGNEGQSKNLREYPEVLQIQSRRMIVLKRIFSFNIGTHAWAQDASAKQIIKEIQNMPDVVKALRRSGERVNIVNKMCSEGKIGEGNKGLLVKREALTGEESAVVNAENADREIIIRGMAKAIVKISKLEPTPENINSVFPQAAEQLADLLMDKAPSGCWIQLANDKWIRK